MNTERERAKFEAWMRDNHPGHCLIFVNGYLHKWPQRLWEAYQAGRAALKAQNADAGLDVEAVLRLFLTGDGFIAECDIPHIVAALRSQDREDATTEATGGDENGGHRLVEPDHETVLALADAPRSLRNYVAALRSAIAAAPTPPAGRAALQSQPMPPEISRDLLGKIVDEVFDGAIEDASVIEDIYRVVARECALQSQDREGAFCVWHNDPETDNSWDTGCRQLFELYDGTPSENRMSFCCYCGKPIQEAIDHARRVEGKTE